MNIIGLNGHSMDNGSLKKNNQPLLIDSDIMVMDVIAGHKDIINKLILKIYDEKDLTPSSVSGLLREKKLSYTVVNSLWTLEVLGELLDLTDDPGFIVLKSLNESIFESIAPYNTLGMLDTNIIDYATNKFYFEHFFNDYIPRHVLSKIERDISELDYCIIKDSGTMMVSLSFSRGNNQLNLHFDHINPEYNGKTSIAMSAGFIMSSYIFAQQLMSMGTEPPGMTGYIPTSDTKVHHFGFRMVDYNDNTEDEPFDEDGVPTYDTLYAGFSLRYNEDEIMQGVPSLDMTMPFDSMEIN